MKITSQSATTLVAQDKAYGALVMAPILVLAGLGVEFLGLSRKLVAADAFGLIFIVVAALLVVIRTSRVLTIDKSAGQIGFKLASVRKKQNLQYQLQDLTKIQLVQEYSMRQTGPNGMPSTNGGFGAGNLAAAGMNQQNTTTEQITHLLLVLRDGTTLDLADGQRSMGAMSMVSHVPNQDIGQQIATFAGVPFEVVGPNAPTLSGMVSGIANAFRTSNATTPSVVPGAPTPAPAAPAQPIAPPVPPIVPPQPLTPPSSSPLVPPPTENLTPPEPPETNPGQ